jgi:hypothetical protein
MQEILPGVFHWSTFHEGIGERVHSCFVTAGEPAFLIDARVPAEGLAPFGAHPPQHVYLTNRHHYRHADRFADAYGSRVWCHEAGLHEFRHGESVDGFRHGDGLPGGVLALPVGVLCPEETAFYLPICGGILAIGDAIIREAGELSFVPDPLLGDDPPAVKEGLREAFRAHLRREFDNLLFAHGPPLIGGGKQALAAFLGAP